MPNGTHLCLACDYDGRALADQVALLQKQKAILENSSQSIAASRFRTFVMSAAFAISAITAGISYTKVHGPPNPPAQITQITQQASVVSDIVQQTTSQYESCLNGIHYNSSKTSEITDSCNKIVVDSNTKLVAYLQKIYPAKVPDDASVSPPVQSK